MPLDGLLRRLREEAEAQAAQIVREAASQRDSVLAEAKAKASNLREAMLQDAERKAEAAVERARASGELEARKIVLEAKQRMINRALDQAVRKLAQMSADEYRRIVGSMLTRAALGLGGGDIEVLVSDEDRERMSQTLLQSLGRSDDLKKAKVRLQLSDEARPTGGGFVLRKGKIESNATFPALAKARREDLEALAAGLLFGDSSEVGTEEGRRSSDAERSP